LWLLLGLLISGGLAHAQAPAEAPLAPPAEAPAEPVERAPAPQIHLVIVGPGSDDYSLYGHAGAVVVDDPSAPITQATLYNFGITNFKRPGYILDFLGGNVAFWGHRRPFGRYLKRWRKADRTVTRYALALTDDAARAMAARMAHDVEPEHKHFIYDTFRNNCATRLRDLLDVHTGGAIWAALGHAQTDRAFRDDVREAYAARPALLLMTEIVPGLALDQPRTQWALSYRPEAFAAALETVRHNGGPLLGPPQIDHRRQGADPRSGNPDRATVFMGMAATILLLIALVLGGVPARIRGLLLLSGAGFSVLLGSTLIVVAATTAWPDMQGSWLVFWFTPLDLGLFWTAGRLIVKRRPAGSWVRGYLYTRLAIAAGLTLASPFLGALAGPLAPRLLGLAGLVAALRCVGVGGRAERKLRNFLRMPLGRAA
jgi:hypothetical protein